MRRLGSGRTPQRYTERRTPQGNMFVIVRRSFSGEVWCQSRLRASFTRRATDAYA